MSAMPTQYNEECTRFVYSLQVEMKKPRKNNEELDRLLEELNEFSFENIENALNCTEDIKLIRLCARRCEKVGGATAVVLQDNTALTFKQLDLILTANTWAISSSTGVQRHIVFAETKALAMYRRADTRCGLYYYYQNEFMRVQNWLEQIPTPTDVLELFNRYCASTTAMARAAMLEVAAELLEYEMPNNLFVIEMAKANLLLRGFIAADDKDEYITSKIPELEQLVIYVSDKYDKAKHAMRSVCE